MFNILAGEANEEGETTDGWEEEDVTDPEVQYFSLNTFINLHFSCTVYHFMMLVINMYRLVMEEMVVELC